MRIAYLIHSLHRGGGMERVLGLKAGLLAARHEVYIITAAQKGRPDAFPLHPGVKRVDLGHSELFRTAYRKSLDKCLREIKPDVTVSLCGKDIFVLPRLTDGSKKVGEFHFSHDKYLLKYGRNPISILRTKRLEKAAAALDAFVVLTKEDRERWVSAVPGVRQIYNPLTFSSTAAAPLSGKRAVAIGRLVPQKRFGDAIKAWAAVAGKYPDWTLDIFGEGKERPYLEKLISASGLEGKVRLMGTTSRIRDELLQSSFILMSSSYEGFPMVLLEAAACGVPMVSYNCPSGPAEIIADGKNGFLVPSGDISALADACGRIISMDRTPLGIASLETARNFSPEAIVSRWEKLFEELSCTP